MNTKEVNEFIHRRAAQYAEQFKLMWTAALGGSAALAEWAGYPARERQGQAEGPSLLTFDEVLLQKLQGREGAGAVTRIAHAKLATKMKLTVTSSC